MGNSGVGELSAGAVGRVLAEMVDRDQDLVVPTSQEIIDMMIEIPSEPSLSTSLSSMSSSLNNQHLLERHKQQQQQLDAEACHRVLESLMAGDELSAKAIAFHDELAGAADNHRLTPSLAAIAEEHPDSGILLYNDNAMDHQPSTPQHTLPRQQEQRHQQQQHHHQLLESGQLEAAANMITEEEASHLLFEDAIAGGGAAGSTPDVGNIEELARKRPAPTVSAAVAVARDVKPEVPKHSWPSCVMNCALNSAIVNQALTNNPGDYGFRVTFDDHEKVTKNMTWTFSPEVGRLYVMLNSQCPFKVSTSTFPPEDSYIVIVAVYKDAVSRRENVVRCPHHCRNHDVSGLSSKFWMNSPHPQAIYLEDTQNANRHCLVVPFETPHFGCQSYTYLFEFMCRNSCLGGVNRRATEIVFLLLHNGRHLARAIIEVKVCACPGRDRRSDEASLARRLSVESIAPVNDGGGGGGNGAIRPNLVAASHHVRVPPSHGSRPRAGNSNSSPALTSSQESYLAVTADHDHHDAAGCDGYGDQWYTVRVHGRSNFEILKRVAEGLELRAQYHRAKRQKPNPPPANTGAAVVNHNTNSIAFVESGACQPPSAALNAGLGPMVAHENRHAWPAGDTKRESDPLYLDG